MCEEAGGASVTRRRAGVLAPAPAWRSLCVLSPPQICLMGTEASPAGARELITQQWRAEKGKAKVRMKRRLMEAPPDEAPL